MICAACKQEFQDGDPVFKIYTYHAWHDSVNGHPEGYIHAACPLVDQE
jgi:hypothetical protein